MTTVATRPTTFGALLAAIPGNSDLVATTSARLASLPHTPPAVPEYESRAETLAFVAELFGPPKPLSEMTEEQRRRVLFPPVSRPDPSFGQAMRRFFQRLHAGRAYVSDSPMRANPLGLLRLVSPLAQRMTEGIDVHTGVESVLRSLALDTILDFGNPGFQGICTLAGQPATFDGLRMLDGEDLFSALLYGLSLDMSYKREIASPDPWVSWYALNERRPLGEFAIEYFPEVDS